MTIPSQGTPDPQAGALLSDRQVRLLRRAIVGMTAILIAGVVLLIGRVIYLVRGSGTQGTAVAQASAVAPALLGDVRLALPAGAEISQVSLSGTRVAVSHSMAGGGAAITILDLATGQVVSRVTIERAR